MTRTAHAVVAMMLASVGALALSGCRSQAAGPRTDEGPGSARGELAGRLSVGQAMVPGAAEGFDSAIEPRTFSFPADHGPHPGFQTEWWYLTGHLATPDKGKPRRFGYQLTFFRSALRPPPNAPSEVASHSRAPSAWRGDQIFMAHFALTDVDNDRFLPFERFSRGALGLAGARAEPFRVWLDDWSLAADSSADLFPLRLAAAQGEVSLRLVLEAGRPAVFQGEAGLSRKGATPGNASYYYSLTRLPTHGRVRIGGLDHPVTGSSWMDREWSTSALEPGIVGWDWFALQLSDGRDVMFYRLRKADGSAGAYSSGSIVEPTGEHRLLSAAAIDLVAESFWKSPTTGSSYPSSWHLSGAEAELDLRIEPLVDDQEHASTFAYWEGAVTLEGTSAGEPVSGQGYMELTGYEPEY